MRHAPTQITNPANMYFIAAELLIFPNTLFQSLSRIWLTPIAIDINSPDAGRAPSLNQTPSHGTGFGSSPTVSLSSPASSTAAEPHYSTVAGFDRSETPASSVSPAPLPDDTRRARNYARNYIPDSSAY